MKSLTTHVLLGTLVAAVLVLVPFSSTVAVVIIDEDFTGEGGCGWQDASGCVPENAGKAGQWFPSGHIVSGGNPDSDWSPLVQNEVGAAGGSGIPSLDYVASLNRTPPGNPSAGLFNMDGIIKFQTADGTDRPAVTGETIAGSFRVYRQNGNIGFGFTDNIAQLQAFQATMPDWNGSLSPVMMPTAFSSGDWESDTLNTNYDPAFRGFSPNVSGHISFTGGFNDLWTHAVVDLDDSGVVDIGSQGSAIPNVDPIPGAGDPDGRLRIGEASVIRFEYTVGNSAYDVLQIDHLGDGTDVDDIVQCNSLDCQGDAIFPPLVPDPGGPMPVGKVMTSLEGLFITGGNSRLTEVWMDDFFVEILPPPLTADFDRNGIVEAGDYVVLRNNTGSNTPLPNDDGLGTPIGTAHYDLWKANFGNTVSGVGGNLVPEPSALGLLLAAMSLAGCFCRGLRDAH